MVEARIEKGQGNTGQRTNKNLKEAVEELKGYIFDCSGYNQSDQFIKTQEQLSIYVGSTYKHGGKMAKAVEDLVTPTVFTPQPPTGYGTAQVNPADKFVWEQEVKESLRERK